MQTLQVNLNWLVPTFRQINAEPHSRAGLASSQSRTKVPIGSQRGILIGDKYFSKSHTSSLNGGTQKERSG
jgi:hypothetical protein